MMKKPFSYKDETGYIQGYLRDDGYWWINYFVIHPDYRGFHLARKLATHFPKKCKLLAAPLCNGPGPMLDRTQLVNFYLSLGFEKTPDKFGNNIMTRG